MGQLILAHRLFLIWRYRMFCQDRLHPPMQHLSRYFFEVGPTLLGDGLLAVPSAHVRAYTWLPANPFHHTPQTGEQWLHAVKQRAYGHENLHCLLMRWLWQMRIF